MKRRFLFTLALLLATTCLTVNHAHAYADTRFGTFFNGTVYGGTYVYTWFSFPIASAGHSCYIQNNAEGPMQLYMTADAEVHWNGGSDSKSTPKHKEVAKKSFGHLSADHSFNMRDKPEGPASISGSTGMSVRNIGSNEKQYGPTARAITHFWLF